MYNIKKSLLILSIALSVFSNAVAMPPSPKKESEEPSKPRPSKRKGTEDSSSGVKKSKKTVKSASPSGIHPEQKISTPLTQGVGLYKTFRTIVSQGSEPVVDISLDPITPEKEEREGSRRFVPSFVCEAKELTSPKEWHQDAVARVCSFRKNALDGRFIEGAQNVALGRISFFNKKGCPVDSPKELNYVFLSGWPSNSVTKKEKQKDGMETLVQKLKDGDVKIKNIDGNPIEVLKNHGIRFITKDYPQDEGAARSRDRRFDPFFEKIHEVMAEEIQKEGQLLGAERLKFHEKLTKKSAEWSIQMKLYFHTEQAIRLSIEEQIARYKKGKLLVDSHYAIIDICSWFDMCWCCGDTLVSEAHLEKKFGLKVYFRFSGINRYPDFPFNETKRTPLGGERKQFQTYSNPKDHLVYETAEGSDYKPYVAHMVTEDLSAETDSVDPGERV